MKSQTKAFLASVMVLALALSSIGGVTYSWFSDTQIVDMDIGTASVGFDWSMSIFPESGEGGIIQEGNEDDVPSIELNVGDEGSFKLIIENTSSIPVDVSAKIVFEWYFAMNTEGNSLIRDDDGKQIGSVSYDNGIFVTTPEQWNGIFYRSWNNLYFNNNHMNDDWTATYSNRYVTLINPDSSETINGPYNTPYNIQQRTQSYDLGEFTLTTSGSNKTNEFDVSYNVNSDFNPNVMKNVQIIISCIQSDSTVETIGEDGQKTITAINTTKPLYFIGQGFTIGISKDALIGVTKIEVNVSNNPINVSVRFYNESTLINPDTGKIHIFFNTSEASGSLTTPAKSGSYNLFCLTDSPTGGSS